MQTKINWTVPAFWQLPVKAISLTMRQKTHVAAYPEFAKADTLSQPGRKAAPTGLPIGSCYKERAPGAPGARAEAIAREGIDKLTTDGHAIGRFTHTAFEHIPHAKFLANLASVHSLSLVDKTRVSRDHEQPTHRE
jgi:hypothetical protein